MAARVCALAKSQGSRQMDFTSLPPVTFFFPRVRTPCGHGAQVIVEGREEQSDGGEKNKETQRHTKPTNTTTKGPQAVSPPSCSLSSVQGETCETRKSLERGLN